MPKKTIHFMGILANVDISILKVSLGRSFKVEGVDQVEGLNLIDSFEELQAQQLATKLFEFPVLNESEGKLYFVSNFFDVKREESYMPLGLSSEVVKFDKEHVNNYLKPKIRLMRLFKEGNICMPLIYYYFLDNGVPKLIMRWSRPPPISRESYTLEDSEVPELLKFVQETQLPFSEPSLELAFDNFDLSYETDTMNLAFLSLMIGLETLFNQGEQELRYSIPRNAAVLLGENAEDSKRIFHEVRDLYDKRSRIVRTGKSRIINEEDLSKLRYYIRESIKESYKIGMDKDDLMELLNSCGFGQRTWKI